MPRPRAWWPWYLLLAFAVLVMTTAVASAHQTGVQVLINALSALLMLGAVVLMGVVASNAVKKQRAEQQRVEAIEELVQLRRWDQAAAMLDSLLSQPTRTMGARLQGLIYLASVLARYHRFADAITVQNYLLDHTQFDPGTGHGLKLMRTMAMLHEDQLFDVDRALGDLRREAPDSAGLALVEIYRDVKTGHAAEAIDIFQSRIPTLRAQLGHRVADAYALVARAHDMLGQEADAAATFEKATLLAPAEELYRRYPEVAAIRDKYPGAAMPQEAAA